MVPASDPSFPRSTPSVLRLLVALLLTAVGLSGGSLHGSAVTTPAAQTAAAALATDETPPVHLAEEQRTQRSIRRRRQRRALTIRARRLVARWWVRTDRLPLSSGTPHAPPSWRGPPLAHS